MKDKFVFIIDVKNYKEKIELINHISKKHMMLSLTSDINNFQHIGVLESKGIYYLCTISDSDLQKLQDVDYYANINDFFAREVC